MTRSRKKGKLMPRHLITWLIFGLIAGAIAKLLTPGRDPGGCIVTMLIGIAGAIVGGFIARALGLGGGENEPLFQGRFFISLAFAVLGAIILLAIYHLIAGRKRA
jgi:uncharacterized membrane protein YeaQ/YmgE (transglycosylase-associated protein family)